MPKIRKFQAFLGQKYFLHKNKWIKSCNYKKYTDKNSNKKIEKNFLSNFFFGVLASNFSVLDIDPRTFKDVF